MNRLLGPALGAALRMFLGSEHPDASPPAQPDQGKVGHEQQLAQPPEVTLYDPDPNHLWNRLHQALHVRLTDLGNAEKEQPLLPDDQSSHALELDACLWPNRSTYLRIGQPHQTALAVLDEFLADDGEKLVREPVKRAFLQRDLWAVFDWTRSWHTDEPGRNLRTRVARAIERLALSPDEIKALPDDFAAVAASNEVAGFPADLWDQQGPWIVIGDDNKSSAGARTLTPVHESFFAGRSAFLVLIRAGDSRDQTIQFIRHMNNNGKLSGAQVVLFRRMLVIDRQGRIRLTPITESLQMRGANGEREFKLDRGALIAGAAKRSIRRVADGESERADLVFLELVLFVDRSRRSTLRGSTFPSLPSRSSVLGDTMTPRADRFARQAVSGYDRVHPYSQIEGLGAVPS